METRHGHAEKFKLDCVHIAQLPFPVYLPVKGIFIL